MTREEAGVQSSTPLCPILASAPIELILSQSVTVPLTQHLAEELAGLFLSQRCSSYHFPVGCTLLKTLKLFKPSAPNSLFKNGNIVDVHIMLVLGMLHSDLTFAYIMNWSPRCLVTICPHTKLNIIILWIVLLNAVHYILVAYFITGGLYLLIRFTYFKPSVLSFSCSPGLFGGLESLGSVVTPFLTYSCLYSAASLSWGRGTSRLECRGFPRWSSG